MSKPTETVVVRVCLEHQTQKALCVSGKNGGQSWIARSQIKNLAKLSGDMIKGRDISIQIPTWLAQKEGLISQETMK